MLISVVTLKNSRQIGTDMTDAVIKGTYSDLKFIKTRKVAQVVIEVPIEQAGAFVEAFGTPQPDKETWVAIARLEAAVAAEKPKGGRLAKKAGILCGERLFQRYVFQSYPAPTANGTDKEIAEQFVRDYCGVESRSQLDHNEDAAARFDKLTGQYEGWSRCV